MIKEASYGQVLFHMKSNIDEPVVELDVNSLYAFAMTQLRIPNGKPKVFNGIIDDIIDCTLIIKVEIFRYYRKMLVKI
jgi:hypothetical protein